MGCRGRLSRFVLFESRTRGGILASARDWQSDVDMVVGIAISRCPKPLCYVRSNVDTNGRKWTSLSRWMFHFPACRVPYSRARAAPPNEGPGTRTNTISKCSACKRSHLDWTVRHLRHCAVFASDWPFPGYPGYVGTSCRPDVEMQGRLFTSTNGSITVEDVMDMPRDAERLACMVWSSECLILAIQNYWLK